MAYFGIKAALFGAQTDHGPIGWASSNDHVVLWLMFD